MVQCKNLTKKYGSKIALREATLHIYPGQIYALLGPNGSGKTTFMKILGDLTKESSGEVLFEGKTLSIQSRKDIAYLPTESQAYPFMTVGDYGKYHKSFFPDFQEEEYKAMLEEMDISLKLNFKSLSTGMDKKVRIAATLARNAKLVLLDEPFNGVDLLAREEIEKMIIDKKTEDKTILLSSHLVEEVEDYVQFAIFFHQGRVLAVEQVDTMQENKGQNLTERYRSLLGKKKEKKED